MMNNLSHWGVSPQKQFLLDHNEVLSKKKSATNFKYPLL